MKRLVSTKARATAAAMMANAILFASRSSSSTSWAVFHGQSLRKIRSGDAAEASAFLTHATFPRRLQSSSNSSSSTDSSSGKGSGNTHNGKSATDENGTTEAEREIMQRAKPYSTVMEERLGFLPQEEITEESLKEHFFILAKHYHPDSSSAPTDAAAAFASIKEAYDVLLKDAKEGRTGTSHARGGFGSGFGDRPSYTDEAKRRARMRALGDGVMFFILGTIVYIIVVATHNRDRLKSRYLLHFFGIFFIVQLFPRLLAATLLFAVHTGYLIKNGELGEQAATVLLVDQRNKNLHVRVEGLHPGCTEHTVVQVEVVVEPKHREDTGKDAAMEQATAMSVLSSATTTLTLDPGVTSFTLPLPPKGEEKSTVYKIKAVDENRKFVVLEKQFKLA